ncbi:MAG: DUF928 domain-containing protein [Burkholderiales bacterium]|nr:DUF928 domain-containing protein [Burkholderiales bacterium]
MIQFVPPSVALLEKLAGADRKSSAYADRGMWYDQLSSISDEIDSRPDGRSLRNKRARMLNQAGFEDAAKFDLEANSGK